MVSMQNKISVEEKNMVIEMKKQGVSNNQIVAKLGNKISPQRVSAIFQQYELSVYKKNNGKT